MHDTAPNQVPPGGTTSKPDSPTAKLMERINATALLLGGLVATMLGLIHLVAKWVWQGFGAFKIPVITAGDKTLTSGAERAATLIGALGTLAAVWIGLGAITIALAYFGLPTLALGSLGEHAQWRSDFTITLLFTIFSLLGPFLLGLWGLKISASTTLANTALPLTILVAALPFWALLWTVIGAWETIGLYRLRPASTRPKKTHHPKPAKSAKIAGKKK